MISFKYRHFQQDLILMAIRWYVAYALSYRDIGELMLERGVHVDHSTLNRWVIHYAPLLEKEFSKNHKQKVGSSWRMDETYIKIKGVWHYLYRAVDKDGDTLIVCYLKIVMKHLLKPFLIKLSGLMGYLKKSRWIKVVLTKQALM